MKIKNGTVLIDLNKTEEELWASVQKDNRWSVNKARKENVTIQKEGNQDICYELYCKMCNYNKLVPFEKKYVFGNGKIFTALKDNKIIAFSVIFTKGDCAFLGYNASNYKCRNIQANSLLYWEIIINCKKEGFKKINLGGVDLHSDFNRGNDRFKKRWGGTLVNQTKKAKLVEYIWWKYLRHVSFLKNLKFKIQTKIKTKRHK